jgi:hypothetical protein
MNNHRISTGAFLVMGGFLTCITLSSTASANTLTDLMNHLNFGSTGVPEASVPKILSDLKVRFYADDPWAKEKHNSKKFRPGQPIELPIFNPYEGKSVIGRGIVIKAYDSPHSGKTIVHALSTAWNQPTIIYGTAQRVRHNGQWVQRFQPIGR